MPYDLPEASDLPIFCGSFRFSGRFGPWPRLTWEGKASKVKQGPKVRQHLRTSKPKSEVYRLMASRHCPTRTRNCKPSASSVFDADGIRTMPKADTRRRPKNDHLGRGKLLKMPDPELDWTNKKTEAELTDEQLISSRLELIQGCLRRIDTYWFGVIEARLDSMYPKTPAPENVLEMPNPEIDWSASKIDDLTDEQVIRSGLELARSSMKQIKRDWIDSIERRLDLMYPKT